MFLDVLFAIYVFCLFGRFRVPILLLRIFFYYQKFYCLPREYSIKNLTSNRNNAVANNRDGFAKRKIPENIDVIIIGSGISALTCGGLLSRVGKKVLILEQHYIAGGCTHLFEDKGYEFDTGVHYLGRIQKRQKLLDLITEPLMEWDRMGTEENEYIYDEINIEGDMYQLRAGRKGFMKEVEKHFPSEVKNVEQYLDDCNETSDNDLFFLLKIVKPKWLADIVRKYAPSVSKFFKNLDETALDRIKTYTDNKRLQAFLLGQFGDYGTDPSIDPFFTHAGVVSHYLEGGWFPKGGSSTFANNIIPVIERSGGRVLVRKAVEEILIENGKAVGVRMKGGVEIKSKIVIASCGVSNTWKRLVPKEYVPRSIIEKIDKTGYSGSFCYVFIGMNKSPEELELRSNNIWHWPSENYSEMIQTFYKDPLSAPIPMFIGFPCTKDSTWNERFPGKSNAVILTLSKYEQFEEWKDNRQGHRGVEYNELKNKISERILNEGLYHYFPKTKGTVDYISTSTPITFNHFIGSTKGEAYGLAFNKERCQLDDWLKPSTHIPNLFQTGQDIVTLGVAGAISSGELTANDILGYGNISDIISGRDLVKDLQHVKDVNFNVC